MKKGCFILLDISLFSNKTSTKLTTKSENDIAKNRMPEIQNMTFLHRISSWTTPVALMQSLGAQLVLSVWWTGLCCFCCCLCSQFFTSTILQPHRLYSCSQFRPAGLLLLPLYHTKTKKMLYFEFFHKWFCARCGVSVWWNYSWSTCFSFSLIGDNGQTWTQSEAHLGLLLSQNNVVSLEL